MRRVLHRAEFLQWHEDFNCWVPSLAGVRFDPDGMSVFVRRLLEKRGDGPGDVATLGGTNDKPAVVYEFSAQVAMDVGYTVEATENGDTPIGYAHASVLKPDGFSPKEHKVARTALAAQLTLAHGHIHLPRPDGA